jgi:hypothetical protein
MALHEHGAIPSARSHFRIVARVPLLWHPRGDVKKRPALRNCVRFLLGTPTLQS